MRSFWSSLPVSAAVCATMAWTQLGLAEPVSATGKGVVGGALLGAEATLITESVLRVRPRWAYALGGALGAALGGTLGYYVEKSGDARWSMVLLTAGTAMVIPTAAITLNATVYREPSEPTMDRTSAGSSGALLSVRDEQATNRVTTDWSLPAVALAPVYSKEELANYGLRQSASVRMPLFNMVF
ncbi:MAG TPA: hypothetical protein VHO25_11490 [Polyangiaceae bacterium]|nr:hypothetical protein [Polyangiaceae bacterium]